MRDRIERGMEVIGADGVRVGTVDELVGNRIKLSERDSGGGRHKGHHQFIDLALLADFEGRSIRLSANAAVAVTFEEQEGGESV